MLIDGEDVKPEDSRCELASILVLQGINHVQEFVFPGMRDKHGGPHNLLVVLAGGNGAVGFL